MGCSWQREHKDAGTELPRSGEELSNFVSVLLETSDEGDSVESLPRFVQQALVRRSVVVALSPSGSSDPGLFVAEVPCPKEEALRIVWA